MNEALPWLVWVLPIVGAILTPIFARIGDRVRDYLAVLFSLAPAVSAALMIPSKEVIHSTFDWIPSIGLKAGVLADPLSIAMANVVAWISFLIMVYSLGYMKGEPNLTRYWFFMNFFIGNMQLIVLSDNLLQLFFGWEGVGLCSYALIGFWHSDEKKYWVGTPVEEGGRRAWGREQAYSPSHAGMKAFITTRVGDSAFLIGLLILYTYSHTFSFTQLAEHTDWASSLASAGLLIPVTILIFGGAVGKSAQFPLQEWLPDAMAGPTSVSALIHAATMVKAGVFLVARVGPIFYNAFQAVNAAPLFFEVVAWIGAFTAFLAATQAVVGREIKKVLAYSTVSQIGYMMLALGAAGLVSEGTAFAGGFTAAFFHLMSHAVFKASLFMAAGALIHACGSKYLSDMGGLRSVMPITFISMLLASASLAGIPPLSGFWSKDAVLAAVWEASTPYAPILFALAVVTAMLTVFYTFRMIGLAFFGEKSQYLKELEHKHDSHSEAEHHLGEAPKVMWIPYTILAVASLAIGVAGPFVETSLHESLEHYLHEFGFEAAHKGFEINPVALGGSIAALAIGLPIGYYIYIARRADPAKIVNSSSLLRALYIFLENRWYINTLYYAIFVDGLARFARIVWRGLELGVIDRWSDATALASIVSSKAGNWFDKYIVDGFINGLAYVSALFSRVCRRIQTGVTQNYLLVFAIGVVVVLIILVLNPSLLLR
ncbi:MAG: NADH-quinone oxidoreductase subunit L [Thaumarchaeota archaeon]|nr:NADH-quinone oxidoreductase subunit L [Nitrososphaerota archaeon]